MIDQHSTDDRSYDLPMRGAANPSTEKQGTSPGSFANRADIGGPLTFSSPDTPGMPPPSDKTAWDFLPDGWRIDVKPARCTWPHSATMAPASVFAYVSVSSSRLVRRSPGVSSTCLIQ